MYLPKPYHRITLQAKKGKQKNEKTKKSTCSKVYHTQKVTKNSCRMEVTILEMQSHFQPLHSPKQRHLNDLKAITYIPTYLFV